MWQQLLMWGLAGPKRLKRFVLLWLFLMFVVFYAFVHEAFDGDSRAAAPAAPVTSTARR